MIVVLVSSFRVTSRLYPLNTAVDHCSVMLAVLSPSQSCCYLVSAHSLHRLLLSFPTASRSLLHNGDT